jgi:hypothetical protein
LFFKLVEDMPASKGMLFDVVDDKETIQKLKAVETPSPAKKDFFKAKREDKAFTVKAILITVAGAALLAFSVISLVK